MGGNGHWGSPAREDKIVQYAVGTLLHQIGEENFLGFRCEFRPGRGQQEARDALWVGIERQKVNWILELDIRSFSTNSSPLGWSGWWNIGAETNESTT
jgi:RNA-directed DNA polymerase